MYPEPISWDIRARVETSEWCANKYFKGIVWSYLHKSRSLTPSVSLKRTILANYGIQMLRLSRWLICSQINHGSSELKLSLLPLCELHRHYSITQMLGSFSNRLLNDTVYLMNSLASTILRLWSAKCTLEHHYILFRDIIAPFCNQFGHKI